MKKLILSLTTLFLIAVVAVFTITNTYSAKNTLLMKNSKALAQEHPNRPPFNCPDVGDAACWTSHEGSVTYEEEELESETINEAPLVIRVPYN